jgi:hypothetical protein
MKNSAYLLTLVIASNYTHQSLTTHDHAMNHESIITIKNLSPAKLTITVKNDPDNPTQVIIPGNDTGSIIVLKPKLNVHVKANYDGKILKTNLRRKKESENYWEITIRKTIIGGIEIIKREHRVIH